MLTPDRGFGRPWEPGPLTSKTVQQPLHFIQRHVARAPTGARPIPSPLFNVVFAAEDVVGVNLRVQAFRSLGVGFVQHELLHQCIGSVSRVDLVIGASPDARDPNANHD